MNIENQVCSLDLAKRLKELGMKPWSYAYCNPGATEYAGIFFLTEGKMTSCLVVLLLA